MTRIKYYCDICGKEMPNKTRNVVVYHAVDVVDQYDCCMDCLAEIRSFIDGRQKNFNVDYKTVLKGKK